MQLNRYHNNLTFVTSITDDIHIWSADLNISHIKLLRYYKYLSPLEYNRAKGFKFDKDRRTFIACTGILREILAGYINISPETISFRYNDFGKPFLANYCSRLYFNSSRSASVALYIFSGVYEVGIDIEKVRYMNSLNDIVLQFFSDEEITYFKKLSSQEFTREFYKLWTKKEAFVKAIGMGLSFPLNQFQVSVDTGNRYKITQIKGDFSEAVKWSIGSVNTFPEYEAAYVYRGDNVCVKFLNFN